MERMREWERKCEGVCMDKRVRNSEGEERDGAQEPSIQEQGSMGESVRGSMGW